MVTGRLQESGITIIQIYIPYTRMNTLELQSRVSILRAEIDDAAVRSGRKGCDIRLIAVTKTHSADLVRMVVDAGITDIGENRVQELMTKAPLVTGAFEWHMIGHLQTNKVKKAVEVASWIQSVDSDRLADEIDSVATRMGKKIKVLVEVNTSGEASKSGCAPDAAALLCEKVARCRGMEFCGLMTIGPLEGGETATRNAFTLLRGLGEKVRHCAPKIEISMGMSSDFIWAIEEGATMVRIGSRLLGERS